MAKKTNKTSHVMDLLTNGASTETDASVTEAVSSQEKKAADVQSHTVTPAKVTVVDEGSRNDRLSQEILGKLTEELEEEARQELEAREAESKEAEAQEADIPNPDLPDSGSQETPEPETASQEPQADAAPEEPAESSQEAAPEPSEDISPAPESGSQDTAENSQASSAETSQDSQDVPEPSQPQEEVSEAATSPDGESQNASTQKPGKSGASPRKEQPHPIIPESQLDNRFQDKEYRFLNVMEQLLMRQNLEAVLTQYEVCTCPRCMSDVCALALTGLPSKYVVTSKDSISPLVSYYENKYKIPVLTELMKACNRVRQNPRHKVTK